MNVHTFIHLIKMCPHQGKKVKNVVYYLKYNYNTSKKYCTFLTSTILTTSDDCWLKMVWIIRPIVFIQDIINCHLCEDVFSFKLSIIMNTLHSTLPAHFQSISRTHLVCVSVCMLYRILFAQSINFPIYLFISNLIKTGIYFLMTSFQKLPL